jgi:L-seryl-tRNA(Ser) seleniumtransferase
MTLAALESTLRLYLNEERALREVPVLRLLSMPLNELRQRAARLAEELLGIPGMGSVETSEDVAYVGGGSLPDQRMKSWVVEIEAKSISDTELFRRLRLGVPAVMARLRGGKLLLDVRTIFENQEALLVEAVRTSLLSTQNP